MRRVARAVRRISILAAALALGGALRLQAAEAPTAPAAPTATGTPAAAGATPSAPAVVTRPGPGAGPNLALPAPFLGITLDHPTSFDADQGLLVTGVVAKSTFDHLGVRVGDRLLSVNGKPLGTVADFSVIADNLTIGQALTVQVRTDDALRTVSGVVEAVSRPREISQKTQQLANEVEQLRSALQDSAHPTMQQTLLLLKQLEADLPGMVDEFHSRYPQGEFDISIHIDILSDRTATHPTQVVPPTLPTLPAPPSAPAPASPPAGSPPAKPATPP